MLPVGIGTCSRALEFPGVGCTGISNTGSSQGTSQSNDNEILAAMLPDDSGTESHTVQHSFHPSPASASSSTGCFEDSNAKNSEEFVATQVWGDTQILAPPSNNLTQCKAALVRSVLCQGAGVL